MKRQGNLSDLTGEERSEFMLDSEDMVWDVIGEGMDMQLANSLNVVKVIGIV